ncbi:MAG TPA: hypothetical protein VGD91_30130 [Trebonia sp.]
MQPLTAPETGTGPQPGRGRWIWRLSGVLTVTALTAGGLLVAARASHSSMDGGTLTALPVRTVTITRPFTALNVHSYGGSVQVTVGDGPVRVTESVSYAARGSTPSVTSRVSRGQLTLDAPACASASCSVAFTVTVPAGVTVNAVTAGGQVSLAGTGAAVVDSGGGPVFASRVNGPLTVHAEGGEVDAGQVTGRAELDSGGGPVTANGISGPLQVDAQGGEVTVADVPAATLNSGGGPVSAVGVAGTLTVSAEGGSVSVTGAGATTIDSGGGPVSAATIRGPLSVTADGGEIRAEDVTGMLLADSGGGPVSAARLSSASATVNADGGGVSLGFARAPESVRVITGGGDATLSVPGGPYSVTTDSGDSGGNGDSGGSVAVPVSPGASRSISVSTDGGLLQIGPA